MKRTVENIMKSAPDTMFYIGSSSGYFFIGKYYDWKRDEAKINEECKKSHKNHQTFARKNTDGTLKELRSYLTAKEPNRNACVGCLARLDKISKTLACEWVDIGSRVPEKIFEKEAGGYAIIVKGLEDNGYWTREEYEAAYGQY